MRYVIPYILVECVLLLFIYSGLNAQEINSSVLSSSGNIQQGGEYSLNYTIGQPSPSGHFSGEQFILSSGFISNISGKVVGFSEFSKNQTPIDFALNQNYPNPFNPSTTIKYSISRQSNVALKVFDVLGSEVSTLVNKEQTQGNYDIEFQGSDLPSGIYFYRLQAGGFVETKKMILLK